MVIVAHHSLALSTSSTSTPVIEVDLFSASFLKRLSGGKQRQPVVNGFPLLRRLIIVSLRLLGVGVL